MDRVSFLLCEDYYILMRAEKGDVSDKRGTEFLNILNPRPPIFPLCQKLQSRIWIQKALLSFTSVPTSKINIETKIAGREFSISRVSFIATWERKS